MEPVSPAAPAFRHLSTRISVSGVPVHLELEIPAGKVPASALLPALQNAASAFVGASEQRSAKRGESASCKKGCGACCRQLVPIAPSEARALARLVDGLPEKRRTAVLARFAEARTVVDKAGLLSLGEGPHLTREQSRETGLDYFDLQVACPFLEEESCSIHSSRPLACREYLVTSPAELCADPAPDRIQMLPVQVKLSTGLQRVSESWEGQRWLPLVLALDWVSAHPEEPILPDGGAEFENLVKSVLMSSARQSSST